MNSIPSFLNKIKQKNATIGIIGLGYVGHPLAIRFSEYGFQVFGFDIDDAYFN
jgi:UDP-N-acetyl-D-glucosamine dehydrogenase